MMEVDDETVDNQHAADSHMLSVDDVADGSSDDSDASADDEELEGRITQLKTQLEENPYLYDVYKELITIYKGQGELTALRDIRQQFSDHFPLTPELWQEWVADESNLISSPEDRHTLIELFEKAVQDYLSVDLWLEYGALATGALDTVKCREVLSQALLVAGYHTTEGKLLWDLRLEYELALLQTMQPAVGACPSSEQQSMISNQTERINGLYKQLIVTPLVGVQSAVAEYEQWQGEPINEELKSRHDKAVEILNSCSSRHENELTSAQTDESKRAAYDSYITSYLNHHSELTSSVKCLFERALANNCLDQHLWIRYTTYLEANCKDDVDILLSVYKRSLRNCPWSGALWVAYTLANEKQGSDLQTLQGYLETALQSGLHSNQDFMDVWTTYCDIIRRKIDWSSADQSLVDTLRQVFERAIQHLLKYYGEEGDRDCILPKYWALIEAKHCSNMEKARQIWNDTMTGWRHSQAVAWLEYVTFERYYGDHKHCRRVFQRALKAVTDWPESICTEYLRFEREEGTLDQLLVAKARVVDVRLKIAEDLKKKARFDKKKHKPQAPQKSSKKGRKPSSETAKESKSPVKGEKDGAAVGKSTGDPVVYKRKRGKMSEGDFKAPAPVGSDTTFKSPVSSANKEPVAPAPAVSEKPRAPAPSLEDDSMAPPEKKLKTSQDYRDSDETTVFVSNLAYTSTEEHIKDKFSQCGHIKEVRLMKGRGDKSKGFAYVEFASIEPVASALQLDRTSLEGRPVYVSPCNRKRADNKPKLKYDTGMERCKLFVSGLSYDLTSEQVHAEFSKHGKVKDVRIVTYKGGKSKGLAYVEFYEENDAKQALLALDNTELNKFTIKVAISNPPPRKTDKQFVASLGGVSKETADSAPRGRARTQLSLMPRVMQKKPDPPQKKPVAADGDAATPPSTSGQTSNGGPEAKKLSNADFRSILLSKK